MFRSLTLTLIFASAATLAFAEPGQREFRPIAAANVATKSVAKPIAKPVEGWKAETVVANPTQEAKSATRRGWEFFDRQQWGESREQFLNALSVNPHDSEAAEGLIMSVYHGDSPGVAYELGQKLSSKMPWLPDMVSEAVAGRAEQLISHGDYSAAKAIVSEIPESESKLSEVRERLAEEKKPAPAPAAAPEPKAEQPRLPSAVEFIKQKQSEERQEQSQQEKGQSRPRVPTGSPKETDLMAAALEAFRDSRFRTSLWYLDRMPDPGPDMRLLKGYNLLETDRFDEAVVVFEDLYRLDSNDPDVTAALWKCLYHLDALDYAADLKEELGGLLSTLSDKAFSTGAEAIDNSCGYWKSSDPGEELNHFVFADLSR